MSIGAQMSLQKPKDQLNAEVFRGVQLSEFSFCAREAIFVAVAQLPD
jgi:hypothetical protein